MKSTSMLKYIFFSAVYVTSCISSGKSLSSGATVVFNSKHSDAGMRNISSYTSTGTFTAEEQGLYLVTVTIRSRTSGAVYKIYKNSSSLIQVYVGSWYSSTYYESGTGVLSVELNAGDHIKVQTGASMYVEAPESCMTIIKIK